MEKLIGYCANEIESDLQNTETSSGRPVFCGMFDSNKRSHVDSYGTCLNFSEFFEVFDKIKNNYSLNDWNDAAKYWLETSSGRPLKLIALYIIKHGMA